MCLLVRFTVRAGVIGILRKRSRWLMPSSSMEKLMYLALRDRYIWLVNSELYELVLLHLI